jgi:hypothetical protein
VLPITSAWYSAVFRPDRDAIRMQDNASSLAKEQRARGTYPCIKGGYYLAFCDFNEAPSAPRNGGPIRGAWLTIEAQVGKASPHRRSVPRAGVQIGATSVLK